MNINMTHIPNYIIVLDFVCYRVIKIKLSDEEKRLASSFDDLDVFVDTLSDKYHFSLSNSQWMSVDEYKEDSFGSINNEYIFYTTEGFTQAPNGEDIENCQLLGRAYGEDKHSALQNLLKENPWIERNDYNPSKISCEKLSSDT